MLPDGGIVVGDAYNNRIQVFGSDDQLRWMAPDNTTAADSARGHFNIATAVATNPEGYIFAVDFENHRIQVFGSEGMFLLAFGRQGSGPGEFERPTDVTVDEEGNLYVVDFGNNRIQKLEPVRHDDSGPKVRW